MSSTLANVLLLVITLITQLVVTDWLMRDVLDLPVKRPLRAAAATLVLTLLTLGPAVVGFDALFGDSISSLSRILLAAVVGVVQTGLVLRLIYRTSAPLALAHAVILHMTWAAASLLVMLCGLLGGLYAGAPLLLLAAAYATKHFQNRELVRIMDSIPPTAPNVAVAQR
jgi:hypothetical protein